MPPGQETGWEPPRLTPAPGWAFLVSKGSHAKETFEDEYGHPWMGKPVSRGGRVANAGAANMAFLAKGEDAGHRIFRRLGLPVAASHVVDLGGTTYHVQRIFTERQVDGLHDHPPSKLTRAQREQLIKNQVGDWLISNHDAVPANHIITGDGVLISIDKGQFMKFLGTDKLVVAESGPGGWRAPGNDGEPYYHAFWRAYETGVIDVDLCVIDEVLGRIDTMPDAEFAELVRPYAEGRVRVDDLPDTITPYESAEALVEAALLRKRAVRAEFTAFRLARARARAENQRRGLAGSWRTAGRRRGPEFNTAPEVEVLVT